MRIARRAPRGLPRQAAHRRITMRPRIAKCAWRGTVGLCREQPLTTTAQSAPRELIDQASRMRIARRASRELLHLAVPRRITMRPLIAMCAQRDTDTLVFLATIVRYVQ